MSSVDMDQIDSVINQFSEEPEDEAVDAVESEDGQEDEAPVEAPEDELTQDTVDEPETVVEESIQDKIDKLQKELNEVELIYINGTKCESMIAYKTLNKLEIEILNLSQQLL